MILSLIILFALTLIYLATTDRYRNGAAIICVQGVLLMAIALLRLHTLNWIELAFIVTETLVFKAIVVPYILFSVIKKTKTRSISTSGSSQVHSLLLSVAALVASASVTYYLADTSVNTIFF
ncbi:MAG: hypothetical protein UHY58_02870, partial [Alistipes sp.]|nr:hypothetical protein [Alistipes sp.]